MNVDSNMARTTALPLATYKTSPKQLNEYTQYLAAGVGRVFIHQLHECTPKNGWTPQILSECESPLADSWVPMCSFVWTEPMDTLVTRATGFAAEEFVMIAARCLHIEPNELVTSVVIFEACLSKHPSLLKPHTFRTLALACFCLAKHMCMDNDITSTHLSDALFPYFAGMCPKRLALAQEQILVILNWRIPLKKETYDTCETYLKGVAFAVTGKQVANPQE